MRIETLGLERFGRFHDFRLGPLGPGLTVIHGENEAGKSTLLAFVRALFFGFPSGRKENAYEPWAGGEPRGHVELRSGDGALYRVERQAGRKGGLVQVLREGQPLGREEALGALLGPVSRDVFRRVFAFSLLELQQLETLQDGEVRDALYGAGVGGVNVASVEAALRETARAVFMAGGNSKAPLNRVLKDLAGQEDLLRVLRAVPERYERTRRRIDELSRELLAFEGEARDGERLLRRLDARLQAWPLHQEVRVLQAELPGVGDFPSDGLGRLEALEERLAALEVDLHAGRSRHAQLLRRLSECCPDARLLAVAEKLARLQRGRDRWDELVRSLPALEERLRGHEEHVSRELRQIGWDEARAQAQDLSVPVREALQSSRSTLEEAEAGLREASRRHREQEEAVERLAELEQARRKAMAGLATADPRLAELDASALAAAVEACRRVVDETESARLAQEEARILVSALPAGALEARCPRTEDLRDQACALREVGERATGEDRLAGSAEEAAAEASERLREEQQRLEATARPRFGDEEALAEARRLRAARQALAEVESLAVRLEAAVRRVQDLQEGAPFPTVPPMAVALAGLALAGILWGQEQRGAAGACLLVLLALAGWLQAFSSARSRRVAGEAVTRRSEAERLARELAGAQERVKDFPSGAALEAAEAALEADEPVRRRFQEADEAVRRAGAEAARLGARARRARDAAERASADLLARRGEWEGWRAGHGLPPGEPEAQLDLLARLEAARRALRQAEAAQARWDRARQVLARSLEGLSVPDRSLPADAPSLLEALGRLCTEAELARRAAGSAGDLRRQHAETVATLEEARKKLARAGTCRTDAEACLRAARAGWACAAGAAGLDPALSPETAAEVLASVARLQQELPRIAQARLEVAERRQELRDMLDLARSAAEQVGQEAPEAGSWAGFVDALGAQVEEASARRVQAAELERQREELEADLVRMDLACSQERERLAGLLAAGGASDAEEFRRRAELAARHRELSEQIRERERAREALGVEPSELEDPRDELETQAAEARTHLEDLETRRAAAAEERTRLQVELEGMERSEELSAGSLAAEELRAQARELAREWAVATLAQRLVRRSRETFERERQPFVLRRAEEHFSRLTGGRYARVYHPLGDEFQLRVETAEGVMRQPEALSRGTAEQLYLALRLGFVEDFCRVHEPLPLVMDDIFVNFDGKRAGRALEVLGELAPRHQVLVFTCHRETVERARQACPSVEVLELAGAAV